MPQSGVVDICGIALIVGPAPDNRRFREMLDAIKPRGDVEESLEVPGALCGTQRLRIVDRDRAVQPWTSSDGRWILCYNGEVYNYRGLRDELKALGVELRSESDTEVVLESFLAWGVDGIRRLRGDFAFAIVDRDTGRTYLGRDPLGVKPLFFANDEHHLYVASEVKALVSAGARITEVLPGHHGWAEGRGAPRLTPYVDLLTLGDGEAPITDVDEAKALVRGAFEDAVRVRVDTDLRVGVILSGGLDSSLTLAQVQRMHPDCIAFTVGTPDSDDVKFASRLTADLGVDHEIIDLAPGDLKRADMQTAVRMGELTEYGDVMNAVVSVPLFRRIHEMGVKVVLAGDGSDELFGGYDMYAQVSDAMRQRLFQHKLHNLGRTELQRVDRTSMGQGVEVRVPFLDLALVELAMRMPIGLKVRDGREKWIVRETFADVLPDYILQRPKNPMSHSSGLHERARLFRSLFPRWYRSYHYDLLAPMRRDFSIVLDDADLDLDRAQTNSEHRVDYTAAEHARDFAGALKWNVQKRVTALISP